MDSLFGLNLIIWGGEIARNCANTCSSIPPQSIEPWCLLSLSLFKMVARRNPSIIEEGSRSEEIQVELERPRRSQTGHGRGQARGDVGGSSSQQPEIVHAAREEPVPQPPLHPSSSRAAAAAASRPMSRGKRSKKRGVRALIRGLNGIYAICRESYVQIAELKRKNVEYNENFRRFMLESDNFRRYVGRVPLRPAPPYNPPPPMPDTLDQWVQQTYGVPFDEDISDDEEEISDDEDESFW